MAATPTSVRLPAARTAWLESWAARTMQPNPIATALAALDLILSAELDRFPLALGEASLLAETVGGPMLANATGSLLLVELHDLVEGDHPLGGTLREHYEHAYHLPAGQVDRLLTRLRAAGPAADFALRDALTRWWADEHRSATTAGFRATGLRVMEAA